MKKRIGLLAVASLMAFGMVSCSTGGNSSVTSVSAPSSEVSSSQVPSSTVSSSTPASSTPSSSTPEVTHVLAISVSGTKKVGETVTFVAKLDGSPLTDQGNVTYTASDASAMTITKNKAVLLKSGDVTVTAVYTVDGKEVHADTVFTVEEGAVVMTIADAKEVSANTFVRIKGQVIATSGTSAYVADATDGVYIYNWYDDSADTAITKVGKDYWWTVGQSVDVYAQMTIYNGIYEISDYDKPNKRKLPNTYAKAITDVITPLSPTVLDEATLKTLTNANVGHPYTITGIYQGGNAPISTGLSTVNFKLGATSFALVTNGNTSGSMYDKDIAGLISAFTALGLVKGDSVTITAPFASIYSGTPQFAYYSHGTILAKVS